MTLERSRWMMSGSPTLLAMTHRCAFHSLCPARPGDLETDFALEELRTQNDAVACELAPHTIAEWSAQTSLFYFHRNQILLPHMAAQIHVDPPKPQPAPLAPSHIPALRPACLLPVPSVRPLRSAPSLSCPCPCPPSESPCSLPTLPSLCALLCHLRTLVYKRQYIPTNGSRIHWLSPLTDPISTQTSISPEAMLP